MRKLSVLLAAVMVLAWVGVAVADGIPSAKAAAAVSNINILNASDVGWTDILVQQIKTNSKADLFIVPSLECGLYTRTKSTGSQTSTAMSRIRVRVLVDDLPLLNYPSDGITYNARTQTLTTQLGTVLVGDVVQDEFVELILDTMAADSFNFIGQDVGVGTHTIKVQAKIDTSISGDGTARATIGFGAVTIENVRLIKNSQTDIPIFQ